MSKNQSDQLMIIALILGNCLEGRKKSYSESERDFEYNKKYIKT